MSSCTYFLGFIILSISFDRYTIFILSRLGSTQMRSFRSNQIVMFQLVTLSSVVLIPVFTTQVEISTTFLTILRYR